jgi:hypothetical protein
MMLIGDITMILTKPLTSYWLIVAPVILRRVFTPFNTPLVYIKVPLLDRIANVPPSTVMLLPLSKFPFRLMNLERVVPVPTLLVSVTSKGIVWDVHGVLVTQSMVSRPANTSPSIKNRAEANPLISPSAIMFATLRAVPEDETSHALQEV